MTAAKLQDLERRIGVGQLVTQIGGELGPIELLLGPYLAVFGRYFDCFRHLRNIIR